MALSSLKSSEKRIAKFPMTPRSTLETLALRLPPDVDLRQTLQSIAHTENITAGIILSGIGSIKTVALRFAGQNTHTTLAKPLLRRIDGKHEILTIAGTIGTGGHVVDGCIIYTTVELTIGILPDLQFQRQLDDRTGFAELAISATNHEVYP
jgi:uncharacterized protein